MPLCGLPLIDNNGQSQVSIHGGSPTLNNEVKTLPCLNTGNKAHIIFEFKVVFLAVMGGHCCLLSS